MISGMESYASTYGNYYNKPLIMTEYVQNGVTPNFDMALLMAWHIHNTLVHEGATSFYWWTLFRYSGNSTGGMINFSSSSYTIRDIYWFFKHYAFFTNPGWYRVGTTTASSDLRITAFRDVTDSNMAIVILNKSTATDVNLTLSLDGFTPPENWLTNEIYRSSSTEHWAYLGTFDPCQSLMIPAQSITTIHIATFQTCADVQNNSHGLYEDLNGDCYVDFYDLQIIADNWLRNDCNGLNDWCNWADWPSMNGSVDFIDLSNFAPEWMQCNNPLDPNCTHNW
jgi:hypothetical protein